MTCSSTSPRTSHLENWRTRKSYNELLLTPLILSLKAGTVKLGRAQVFCLKAFTPRGAPLIIFYSNVSARKVTKPEVYCPLIYPPSPCAGMKWITPFPLNSHDSWTPFTPKKKDLQRKNQPTINKRHPGSKSNRGYDGAGGVQIREWSLLAVTCFIEDGLIHSALTPTAPPPRVNINVWALRGSPCHTSAGKSH